jgi:hypothetical protein
MVDVGGGIGSLALKIAKVHPHIRMVIQDRPMVIEKGEEVCHTLIFGTVRSWRGTLFLQLWKTELPDALSSGRVRFEGTP